MPRQLPLDLKLRSHASFGNFIAGANGEPVAHVVGVAEGREPGPVLLWGPPASGKTHLLESALRAAAALGRRGVYLPLQQADALAPALLDDLEQEADLICIDDLQAIAGQRSWEQALFALYARSERCPWIFAARTPPASSGFCMPELATRLGAGPVYQLRLLADEEKLALVEHRARALGLALQPGAARYLIERYARDLDALMRLLDRIDVESVRCQRRPTIAFIRGLEQ